jgi:hypothetical protein
MSSQKGLTSIKAQGMVVGPETCGNVYLSSWFKDKCDATCYFKAYSNSFFGSREKQIAAGAAGVESLDTVRMIEYYNSRNNSRATGDNTGDNCQCSTQHECQSSYTGKRDSDLVISLSDGGTWRPHQHPYRFVPALHQWAKLNVLVPIRNRDAYIGPFLQHLNRSMVFNGIHAEFFIIEQVNDDGRWNKGLLFNIAYLFANGLIPGESRVSHSDRWLFSDVDVFETRLGALAYRQCVGSGSSSATSTTIDESASHAAHHLYGIAGTGGVSQYGVLGGAFCMPSALYDHVNGFSNKFWKWGFEDMDMEKRIWSSKSGVVDRKHLVPRINGRHRECGPELGVADLGNPESEEKSNKVGHNASHNTSNFHIQVTRDALHVALYSL